MSSCSEGSVLDSCAVSVDRVCAAVSTCRVSVIFGRVEDCALDSHIVVSHISTCVEDCDLYSCVVSVASICVDDCI